MHAKRCGWLAALTALSAGLVLGVFAVPTSNRDAEQTDDWAELADTYAWYEQHAAKSVDDLVHAYELDQLALTPLLPPAPGLQLVTGQGRAVLFDPGAFPEAFIAGLLPVTRTVGGRSFIAYPIRIGEDPATRNRIIWAAAEGKEVELLRVKPPADYDPYWYVRELFGVGPAALEDSWLGRIFDPARIVGCFELVTKEALLTLVAGELDERSSTPQSPLRMLAGSPASNLCFTAVELADTNGAVCVSMAWPEDFTNRIALIACTNLLSPDWTLLLTTNAPAVTNAMEWVDEGAPSYAVRFYHAYNADYDGDGDGVSDGVERFFDGTDPDDPNDPPNLEGTISYTTYSGGQTGPIHVVAVPSAGSWSTNVSDTLSAPGAYHIVKVPAGNYWIKAWRDSDMSGSVGTYEATGVYSAVSIAVTNQRTGIDIMLTDPDTDGDGMGDWWELHFFPDLSETNSADYDLDKLSNLLEYHAGTDPTAGFVDNDGDGMSADWELAYGLDDADPSDAADDPDQDGFTSREEFLNGGGLATDPTDPLSHPSGVKYVDGVNGSDTTGDGSFTNAYATISTGIAQVADWGRVAVKPGTYTGSSNRGMDVYKSIVVVGIGGYANTTINCGGGNRAFFFGATATNNLGVRGFTIESGYDPSSTGGGGAIRCGASSPFIEKCYFIGNVCAGRGGAIYAGSRPLHIRDCVFGGNYATNGNGGAVALELYDGPFTATVERCVFDGNFSSDKGGGLYVQLRDGAKAVVRNSQFTWNDADEGAALYCGFYSVGLTVENCTVAENDAGGAGAAIQGVTAGAVVRNCIAWDNSPAQLGGAATNNVTYCDIEGWTLGGTGNITNAPGFLSGWDFRFGESSPCRDAGHNETWMTDATDLFGNPRIANGTVDMGHSEYQSP